METISYYAGSVRDVLCNPLISWMGLCGTGQRFESSISGAASTMREVQSLSEELHATYITLPAIWGALQAFFLAGLIMIAIGTILIARLEKNVRRRNVKPKARVPSGLNFYKYGTA